MTDMTGWILCDRVMRNGKIFMPGDKLYLVLGPVPTRPPYERWTLIDMRTNERVTLHDADVRNVFRFKRLA